MKTTRLTGLQICEEINRREEELEDIAEAIDAVAEALSPNSKAQKLLEDQYDNLKQELSQLKERQYEPKNFLNGTLRYSSQDVLRVDE